MDEYNVANYELSFNIIKLNCIYSMIHARIGILAGWDESMTLKVFVNMNA